MSVSLLERLFARVSVGVGESGIPRQAGTPPASATPSRLGVGIQNPVFRPPSVQIRGGIPTTSGIVPPMPPNRRPYQSGTSYTRPPYSAPQPAFRAAPGLPNAAESLRQVREAATPRAPRYTPPSALPSDRFSPALSYDQISARERALRELSESLINRTRAIPGASRSVPRVVAEARPRIPAIRPRPGLLRIGPSALTLGRALLPDELIDASNRPREALIDRLSAPAHPRMEPYAEVVGPLVRDAIPAELRAALPGNAVGFDIARVAGSWLFRRYFDRVFGPEPEIGDQLGPPAPAPPPEPIARGTNLYKLRITTQWNDPIINQFYGGTFFVQAWGPIHLLQWTNAGQNGPQATSSGAYLLAHGNSLYSSTQFNSPNQRTASPIWANIGGGGSDESQGGSITYRIWPATQDEPETPMIPVQPGIITITAPPRPIAPLLPPGIQTPESPTTPQSPPTVATPGLPLIPAFSPAPGPSIETRSPTSAPSARAPSTPYFPPPPLNPPSLQTPTRTTTLTGTGGDPLNCRFTPDPFTARIDSNTQLTNQKLDQLFNLLGDTAIMGKLNTIDNKLGPQLGGGIGGVLKNFARSNMVQSFLNALTFITALHNALMLSNSVRQTLFSAFDLIYQLPGMAQFAPRDPETGEVVDYGTWASDQFDTLLRAAFGDQTVDTVRNSWNRASRIYQAASNLLFSIQSIMWSLQEALEIVGNYVAKIGNALRKFGVVTERAYSWMNPQAADSRKLSRVFNAINNTSEAVENIEQVAAASLDITETAAELGRQSQAFDRALRGLNEQGEPDPNLEIPFPYGDNREPQHVAAAEGTARETAQNFDQSIDPNDEQRQEPAQ